MLERSGDKEGHARDLGKLRYLCQKKRRALSIAEKPMGCTEMEREGAAYAAQMVSSFRDEGVSKSDGR